VTEIQFKRHGAARRSRGFARILVMVAGVSAPLLAHGQTPESTPATPAGTTPEPTAASATQAPAAGQVYEPAFFERFAPQTAFDMVRNIPGFSLERGEDRRGFGQGGDNVLINGRRLSGKSNGVFEVLGRIGASSVIRIEIVDGATLRMPGLSGQVANIVTKPQGVTGRWRLESQLRSDTAPSKRGGVNLSGESGPVTWTLGVNVDGGNGGGEGPERVTDAFGRLTDLRQEQAESSGMGTGVNASMTYQGRQGDVLNLSVSADFPDFTGREISLRSGQGQPDRTRVFQDWYQGSSTGVGADYEFGVGGGRLKLIGLSSQETDSYRSDLLQGTSNGAPLTGSRFFSEGESGESILRAEFSPPGFLGGDWQVATEAAFNFLENDNRNQTRTTAGAYAASGTPEATRVEERRAELTLTHTRDLWEGWGLQGTLGGEYSEISQTGAGGLTREFVRPKGFVSLSWDAAPDLDLSFRVERKVGQLDFGDFAASSDLNDETQRTGNVDLVPEQSWVADVEINRRMGAWGALKLKVFNEAIEDVVDQIPIFLCSGVPVPNALACPTGVLSRREGVGNIDTAERYGVALSGTINLDPIGGKGMKIDIEAELDNSRVTDPVTGRDRRIGGQTLSAYEFDFRHDVPGTDLAWGFGAQDRNRSATYSLTQRGRSAQTPFAFVFVEDKDLFGMRARLQVMNLLDVKESFRREVYNSGRDGALSFVEDRTRTSPLSARIIVSHTF
jgi:hypothetical protein